MSTLLENSVGAERERGCVFATNFKSASEVVEDGVISGTPIINNGITFDDDADAVAYTGVLFDFDNDEPATIVFRTKFTSSTLMSLISKSSPSGSGYKGWQIYQSAGEIYFRLYESGVFSGIKVHVDGTSIRDGVWHNVVVRYTGSQLASGVSIFIDGVDTTLAVDHDAGFSGSTLNTVDITLGQASYGGIEFTGSFKLMKFFSTALTDQECLDYSNGGGFWNYENEALVNLPMKLENHDPTALKSLDISGNGNDVTIGDGSTAATYPTKLTNSQGYNFDGSAEFLTFALDFNSYIAGADKKFSMSAWVKQEADATQTIFGKYETTDGNNRQFIWRVRDDRSLIINFNFQGQAGGAARIGQSTGTLTQKGVRIHVAFTYDGSLDGNDGLDRVEFYIDGEKTGKTLLSTAGTLGDIYAGNAKSAIGAYIDTGGDYEGGAFDGDISGFKFWDSILTPMQIKDLYLRELRRINDL